MEPPPDVQIVKQYGRRLVVSSLNESVLLDFYGEAVVHIEEDMIVKTFDAFIDFEVAENESLYANTSAWENPPPIENQTSVNSTYVVLLDETNGLELLHNLVLDSNDIVEAATNRTLEPNITENALDNVFASSWDLVESWDSNASIAEFNQSVEGAASSVETSTLEIEWQFASNSAYGMQVEKVWAFTNGSQNLSLIHI